MTSAWYSLLGAGHEGLNRHPPYHGVTLYLCAGYAVTDRLKQLSPWRHHPPPGEGSRRGPCWSDPRLLRCRAAAAPGLVATARAPGRWPPAPAPRESCRGTPAVAPAAWSPSRS